MDTEAMLCPNFLLLADEAGLGGVCAAIGRESLGDPGNTSGLANDALCLEYRAFVAPPLESICG